MAYTAVDDSEANFQVKLFTGTGASGSTTAVTLDGDTDLSPNLVWVIHRNAAGNWKGVADTIRGVEKGLHSNSDNAQADSDEYLTAFGSDGFTVGENGSWGANNVNYVSLCWKESATAGFDIVDYDGNGSNRTISHSLSAVPHVMFIKEYSHNTNWACYHRGKGNTHFIKLNANDAPEATDNFQDTDPTSSVFSVGTGGQTNNSSRDYINYLFTSVQGFSKFGSFIGNGDADGPFVFLGFEPAFVILKYLGDNGKMWYGMTNKQSTSGGFNPIDDFNVLSGTEAEQSETICDFLANGFKIRTTQSDINDSGEVIGYYAWARAPFVNSSGVPACAR